MFPKIGLPATPSWKFRHPRNSINLGNLESIGVFFCPPEQDCKEHCESTQQLGQSSVTYFHLTTQRLFWVTRTYRLSGGL